MNFLKKKSILLIVTLVYFILYCSKKCAKTPKNWTKCIIFLIRKNEMLLYRKFSSPMCFEFVYFCVNYFHENTWNFA